MWSGRLRSRTSRRVEEYTTSIAVDRRLYGDDIDGSIAHLHMLRSVGLVSAADARAIEAGLRDIRREFDRNTFVFDDGDEDIHSAIERRLYEVAGEVAGRLHTGRSRNDQVATDLRMYAKRVIRELMLAIAALQETLIRRAKQHRGTLMPGYTHGQRAQVVSLAHHLLAYVRCCSATSVASRMPTTAVTSPAGQRRAGCIDAAARPPGCGGGAELREHHSQLAGRCGRPGLLRGAHLGLRAAHGAPVAARRGGGAVDIQRVRLRRAAGQPRHRLIPHAAEEEPRRAEWCADARRAASATSPRCSRCSRGCR